METGCEMAAREIRGQFLDLWSNFSSARASNRNLYKYSWMGEESVALQCRGEKRGRALFSTWKSIFSFLAASFGLFPVHTESKFSCTDAWAWCRNQNRNKFMARDRGTAARGSGSLGWADKDREGKSKMWCLMSAYSNWTNVITNQNIIGR